MKRWLALAALLALAAPAAGQGLLPWSDREVAAVKLHGPWPPPPPRDTSNRVLGRPSAILLGQHLFNEPRLSSNAMMSCADCHQPGLNWTDGRKRGVGLAELDRRTPTLWNVAFQYWFGWDGGSDSLWMQSIRPILDKREMDNTPAAVAKLVREDKVLACGYERAFGAPPGSDDEHVLADVGKALAAFQATLITSRSPFDEFRDALVGKDKVRAALYPQAAQRGLKLFLDKGSCNNCHFGPQFTNGEFGDVGIAFFIRPGEVDNGRFGGIAKLLESPFNRLGRFSDDPSGASATRTRHIDRQHKNFGEFKVPSLRQVGQTAPYMHDGSLPTLESVVKHYSEVSADRLHSDGTPLVRALGLTAEESSDLVAFLRSLD
ncbi:MAG TPA: cytochrome c peroxidase, partial [Reyranellaceae bacterium]|nr:cytochrome c peroxidase [Reyranellaceae bacterium]